MSDTPLFEATLSDVLARVRREAEARVAPTTDAVREAQLQAVRAEQRAQALEAQLRAAAVEVDRLRRESQVRAAIVRDQVEDAVRAELASAAPPLIDLSPVEEDAGPVAPPIPAFDTLRTSGARIDAFFDSLIGP